MGLAALLLGLVSVMLWIFSVGAGVYVWWRYVKIPWDIMRRDLTRLAERLDEYDARLGALDEFTRSSRVQGLTDEEAASRERRYRMRRTSGVIVP